MFQGFQDGAGEGFYEHYYNDLNYFRARGNKNGIELCRRGE